MDGEIMHPLYRSKLFFNLKRLADYEKMKILHQSIMDMIEKTEPKVKSARPPRNPRQDIIQRQDKNNLRVLQRQKQRLEERMNNLERMIQEDIDASDQIE
jgi:hypothetical protein